MGYARLYFNNTGANTVTHVLHDIVGVITGTYTSTSQLTVADKALSEIVNTKGTNWSFLYPATHGTKGNTEVSWVLSARCESSPSKLKYIRLSSQAIAGGLGQAGGTTLYSQSAGNGIKFTAGTSATSNTVIANETHYNTTTSQTRTTSFHTYTGNRITLSWSNRHLLIHGLTSGSATQFAFTGLLETTESGITTYRGSSPVIFFHRGHYDIVTAGASATSTTVTGPSDTSSVKNDCFLVLDHYNANTAVITGVSNVYNDINSQKEDMTLFAENSASVSAPSVFTKSSTGQLAIYMQPLFYHQHHIGIPHMYMSNLTDIYRVDNDIANNWDTFTVGNDTYVYLTIVAPTGNLPASGFALAVKKA